MVCRRSYLPVAFGREYRPEAQHYSTVDTCSKFLDLPTCAAWEPDTTAFLKLTTKQLPTFLGCWVLIGICAASMSTSDGAILAISTVLSTISRAIPGGDRFSDVKLLTIVRVSIIPVTLIACIVASTYNETGYLLIVAFDIVLAGCIAPLFAAIYFKKSVTPGDAPAPVLFGSIFRAILEFALPKDGLLAIPHGEFNFHYGPGEMVWSYQEVLKRRVNRTPPSGSGSARNVGGGVELSFSRRGDYPGSSSHLD
ncbi:Solute:Sodium symporter family [Ectocarpus siliculosus]|uniref:Solute:Sodium symporter family n=1 Tax=Ectocarpus siliculosus TaxID=2880 RepID=D8LH33_ECTSI|nr:Solute:Sodium symporter family [Ectocarpus siliculosus]|eukprot:CBN75886.1 Solute:Sodium symporter family [Ectocarpus siliculosus]